MDQDADRDIATSSNVGLGIGLVLGVPIMLIGVIGLVRHTAATPPSSYLRFLVGGDILHDFLVAPIAALVGVLILRRVPKIASAPLRLALFGSAVVVAIAWPGIRHYGRMRTPDNASVQPLNYATATLTVVGVVVAITAIWLAVAWTRSRRSSPTRHR
jgi:hypothetical protein